jgi:hypothetical protein
VHQHFLASAFLLAACASAAPLPPSIAASAPPAPTVPELHVSSALEPVALACRAAELAQPNALDDDCDGNLDNLERQAELSVAWASAGGAEIDVELLDASGHPITPQRERHSSACHDDGAARSSSKAFDTLPSAATKLVIRQLRPCKDKGPVTVVVGLGTRSGAHSYLLSVAPDAPITLGELH